MRFCFFLGRSTVSTVLNREGGLFSLKKLNGTLLVFLDGVHFCSYLKMLGQGISNVKLIVHVFI